MSGAKFRARPSPYPEVKSGRSALFLTNPLYLSGKTDPNTAIQSPTVLVVEARLTAL